MLYPVAMTLLILVFAASVLVLFLGPPSMRLKAFIAAVVIGVLSVILAISPYTTII